MKAKKLEHIPFPDCCTKCELVEIMGVGECVSVCPKKFPKEVMENVISELNNVIFAMDCDTNINCNPYNAALIKIKEELKSIN